MPTIKIDDLQPRGAELFSDSESYMNELGDGELDVYGGRTTPVCRSIVQSVVKASKAVSKATKKGYEKVKSTVYVHTPRIPRPLTFSQYCTGW
jgi:hypothetical protein